MVSWLPWIRRKVEPLHLEKWLPPVLPPERSDSDEAPRAKSPVAAPLHVLAGSALVRVENGVIVIERVGEPKFERPIEMVASLHIHGWATITSPCVAALVQDDVPVLWRGPNGYPVGFVMPMHAAGLDARRAQYIAATSPAGLKFAQAIVSAKITNMRGVARRRASDFERGSLEALSNLAKRATTETSIDALLGLEGAATAKYFSMFHYMLSDRVEDVAFEGRTRRPPQDEVNALLSYCYAILAGECVAALAAAGLDPRLGFLHKVRAGRPALALDLMEPFRPVIADMAVLSGLNLRQITADHFVTQDRAVSLTEAGRRLAIDLLERRFTSTVTLDGRTEPVSWREVIGISAADLARALRAGQAYQPIERA